MSTRPARRGPSSADVPYLDRAGAGTLATALRGVRRNRRSVGKLCADADACRVSTGSQSPDGVLRAVIFSRGSRSTSPAPKRSTRLLPCAAARGRAGRLHAALPDSPDGVFVEDTAVFLDDVIVIARPGPSHGVTSAHLRGHTCRPPTAFIIRIRPARRRDVTRAGRTLFVGVNGTDQSRGSIACGDCRTFWLSHATLPVSGCLTSKARSPRSTPRRWSSTANAWMRPFAAHRPIDAHPPSRPVPTAGGQRTSFIAASRARDARVDRARRLSHEAIDGRSSRSRCRRHCLSLLV